MTLAAERFTPNQKNIINILLMQAVWFACVVGGNLWGWAATLIFFGIYQAIIGSLRKEWLCILAIAFIGLVVDSTLSKLQLMIYPDKSTMNWMPVSITSFISNFMHLPGWMAALWLAFATLFLHGFQWLHHRPLLAAAAGAVLGPANYYAGAQLHGVKLGMILTSFFLCYGILWAIMMPLFINIASNSIASSLDHE